MLSIGPDSERDESSSAASSPLLVWLREVVETFLPAIVIVAVLNIFLAQPRVVRGESMEPNFHDSQRLIVDMISYRFREPVHGEVIVLDVPGRQTEPPLIKRVIGLPDDVVEIRGGSVYVNGEQLQEPYLAELTLGAMPPTIVPVEHVFVLGDNRNNSNDSRYFGAIPYEDILGRAWLCYWPIDQVGAVR